MKKCNKCSHNCIDAFGQINSVYIDTVCNSRGGKCHYKAKSVEELLRGQRSNIFKKLRLSINALKGDTEMSTDEILEAMEDLIGTIEKACSEIESESEGF